MVTKYGSKGSLSAKTVFLIVSPMKEVKSWTVSNLDWEICAWFSNFVIFISLGRRAGGNASEKAQQKMKGEHLSTNEQQQIRIKEEIDDLVRSLS